MARIRYLGSDVDRAIAFYRGPRVLPTVRKVDGYAGAMLLKRAASDAVEIIVITW